LYGGFIVWLERRLWPMNQKSGGETQKPTPFQEDFGKMRPISDHRKHQSPQGQAACAIFNNQSGIRR
jgi:hypothetical protein